MKSIRQRLTVALLAGFSLVLCGAGAGVYFTVRTVLFADLDAALRARAELIAGLVTADRGRVEAEIPEPVITNTHRERVADFYALRLADGTLLKQSNPPPPRMSNAPEDGGPLITNTRLTDAAPARGLSVSFAARNEDDEGIESARADRPRVTFWLVRDCSGLNRTLRTLLAVLGGAGIVALGGTVALVRVVIRDGLRPLDGLAAPSPGSMRIRSRSASRSRLCRPSLERFANA